MKPLSGLQPCVSVAPPFCAQLPVRAAVEGVGQGADLVLVFRVAIEVRGGGQHAREQERRVDGGQLALPDAPPGLHVEEVVVEPLVAGGVRLRPLRAVPEEPQLGEHPLGHEVAGQDPALDDERGRRQGHPDRGDAAGRAVLRLVPDQPVAVVDLVNVVLDRPPLEGVQLLVADGGLAHRCVRWWSG